MAKKKKNASASSPEFDEAETLVQESKVDVSEELRELILGPDALSEPPALPLALKRERKKSEDWLASLPDATRDALEQAKEPARSWPEGPRMHGAIAKPLAPPKKKG